MEAQKKLEEMERQLKEKDEQQKRFKDNMEQEKRELEKKLEKERVCVFENDFCIYDVPLVHNYIKPLLNMVNCDLQICVFLAEWFTF